MQAAMKVVNDVLQKNQNKNMKNQLKSATMIIQQEWFKISSCINADPLDVEDYLDCFDDVSSILLEYIVNMTDSSVRLFTGAVNKVMQLQNAFRETQQCITQYHMVISM